MPYRAGSLSHSYPSGRCDTHAMLRFRSAIRRTEPASRCSPSSACSVRRSRRCSTAQTQPPAQTSRPHRRSRPRKPAGRANEAAAPATAAQRSRRRGRASPARWRLAARLHDGERRRARGLSAAGRRAGPIRNTSSLYAAVSYTPKGAKKPALGTVKVESDTSVALDERLVSFSELKITEPNFPTLPARAAPDRRRGDRRVGAARASA